MASPSWSIDPTVPLVADASIVISLNATGGVSAILGALPNPVLVADIVVEELEGGRAKGRSDAERLAQLAAAKLVQIVSLGDVGLVHFEALVVGPAIETLDDGEAATIASALERKGAALIDERKAMRISRALFPALELSSTIDVFRHPAVERALGPAGVADAVFNALRSARMRVAPEHHAWVLNLLGPDRAALCHSLPASIRKR